VVKLNPAGGIQWQKVLGGKGFETGRSIRQTTDNGYILIGSTDSDNSGDVGPNHGGSDIWVVKLNPSGGIQWQKVLGGTGFEAGRSIDQMTDGGYILTGTTDSDNSGNVGSSHGGSDIWVVKLNTAGDIQWQKVLGGSGREESFSIHRTTGGACVLTGSTDSENSGDVGANHGESDIWVVNLNPSGVILWQKVLGGKGFDVGRSIEQSVDDGYILAGSTTSDDTGDVGANHGGSAIWVVKLGPTGDLQWQKVLGGNGFDAGRSIEQGKDNSYILAGNTNSDNSGDVGSNHGGSSLWVVKLNQVGDIQWQMVPGEVR
jgi:cephalosporin hydroxylase